MNDLDCDPIPDSSTDALSVLDATTQPDAVMEFRAAAARVGSLDAAVRLWCERRGRLLTLGGSHARTCHAVLITHLADTLRTTPDAARKVFYRALGKVDPTAALLPEVALPPVEDGWSVHAVGTIDTVRLDEVLIDRHSGDIEITTPVFHVTVRTRDAAEGLVRVRYFWIVCDQPKYRDQIKVGARVAVDVILNRRYAGTHCSVWRYLLVSLTPVEKGA